MKFINPRRIDAKYEQEWLEQKNEIRKITKKEWIEIFPEAVIYLETDLLDNLEKLEKLKKFYSDILDKILKIKNENDRDFNISLADCFIGEEITKAEKRIQKINQYLEPDVPSNGRITEQDIERAKKCDWEHLITPTKKYKDNHFTAICPFHNEKTASFLVKNDFGYCFGCGWNGDTIKFIMELEGISFVQAVKKLK